LEREFVIQSSEFDEVATSFDYSYDQSGNIVEEETSVGSISHYVYDGNNQLTKETLPDGTTIDYQYDAVGNRLETKQGSKVDSFEYNDANQIKTKNGVNYTYDADGNLTRTNIINTNTTR
jgi:RHS Repeat.